MILFHQPMLASDESCQCMQMIVALYIFMRKKSKCGHVKFHVGSTLHNFMQICQCHKQSFCGLAQSGNSELEDINFYNIQWVYLSVFFWTTDSKRR